MKPLRPILVPPLLTVTVACHGPAKETFHVALYLPSPTGRRVRSFLVSGILLIGQAAITNETLTSTSLIAFPSEPSITTSNVLSPVVTTHGCFNLMLRLRAGVRRTSFCALVVTVENVTSAITPMTKAALLNHFSVFIFVLSAPIAISADLAHYVR